jgi:FkbM family methyltransferase
MQNIGAYRALGLIIHRWLGHWLNPEANYVWGSLREDALVYFILTEQLGIREPGFYVDVGCNDPILHSNTWRLYQLGWSGIAIDANKALIDKYRHVRPRDIAVHSLVSDEIRAYDFYILENDRSSSVHLKNDQSEGISNKIKLKMNMQTVTLTQILINNRAPKEFALLKVDVEGHDYQVIKSIDLDTYRPAIIMVESHEYGVQEFMKIPMCVYLQSAGYYLHSLAGYNAIFLRR